MQRCIRIVGALARQCALRRFRHFAAAHGAVGGLREVQLTGAALFPLTTSSRTQATSADRRFHCSVCKKSFRLEMAAKLHVQQVHNGEGAVEAGAGPGQPEEQTAHTPVGVLRNAPPQAPTVVSPVLPEPHDRSARREKPAPKPLHEAEREVPALVMEKMLSVWDDIGLKRMGGQFVHSSMVMRVFAAKPFDSGESPYGEIIPEGENPFESGATVPEAATDLEEAAGDGAYRLNLADAFAMATEEAHGPCRPAQCPNPFLWRAVREVSRAAPRLEATEQRTAPVTPFGQLPIFGQSPPPPLPPSEKAVEAPTAAPAAGAERGSVVSSPFAASVADSPFAGTVTSPFAEAAYSPFAVMETAAAPAEAPPAAAAPFSPATAVPSPFQTGAANVPPSPFAAAAASPFAASPFLAADGAAAGQAFAQADYAFSADAAFTVPAAAPAAAEDAPSPHVCAMCEKRFSSHDGLRMHSKAKHGVELPKEEKTRKKASVPDLPAYIPSPVDLSMTSPFGSATQAATWADVELTPYAQSISNITVAGKVLEVEVAEDGSTLLTVHVQATATVPEEIIPVRCSTAAMRTVGSAVVRGERVFVCGTLRLLPVTDEVSKKKYACPVVHVTTPTGVVAKLN